MYIKDFSRHFRGSASIRLSTTSLFRSNIQIWRSKIHPQVSFDVCHRPSAAIRTCTAFSTLQQTYNAKLARMATPRTRDIVLTDNAHKIRRLLLDAASSGDQSAWANIELRFAGGCVRDMLLGIESNDIDVAISTKTGMEVAILFQMYLENPANLAKHGLTDDDIGKTYKVEANPEKSKHLETATMRVCGIDLDFVNLRKEVYKDDSRTPEMEFATAEEDAYRRDAKINALFYNLHTERIEDFVGGLDDLDNKIISTPLEPKKTFVDDPLRVLRLIRFSTRLNFIIEEQTRYFMSDSDVVDALKKKISRERVGIEFDKMIKG